MAKWCLPKNLADSFLQAVRDGKLHYENLQKMSVAKRKAELAKYVGKEAAEEVNLRYERALISRQKNALVKWFQETAQIDAKGKRVTPKETETGMLARINRLEKPLTENRAEFFMRDLVEDKLGINLTVDEGNKLFNLAKNVEEAGKKLGSPEGNKAWGFAQNDLDEFIVSQSLVGRDKLEVSRIVTEVGGFAKSLKATWDYSAPFRQGFSYFITGEWRRASFNMFKYSRSEQAVKELNAVIRGSEYYDLMRKAKLDLSSLDKLKVSKREEDFVGEWAQQVPFVKGSERAYSGFLTDLRANRFITIMENAKREGRNLADISTKELESIGQAINTGTGRGKLDLRGGVAQGIAEFFFSPRLMKSRIDMFNPAYYASLDGAGRKEAFRNLISTGVTVGVAISTLKAMGVEVETDPRSTNFLHAKVGNMQLDLTGGYGQYLRAATQTALAVGTAMGLSDVAAIKTSTGEFVQAGTGEYGQRNAVDILGGFVGNKKAPFYRFVEDMLTGYTFDRRKIGFSDTDRAVATGENLIKTFIPIIAESAADAIREGDIDQLLIGTLAEGIGIGTKPQWSQRSMVQNVYGGRVDKQIVDEFNDLSQSGQRPTLGEIENNGSAQKYKEQFGNAKYKEAINNFRKELNEQTKDLLRQNWYKNSDPEERKDMINEIRRDLIKDIFTDWLE